MTDVREEIADLIRDGSLQSASGEPKTLAQLLEERDRPMRVVDFVHSPFGANGKTAPQIMMRVLSVAQHGAAIAAAHRFATRVLGKKKAGEELGYDMTFSMRFTIEVLMRACLNAGDSKLQAFPTPEFLMHQLTQEEIERLLALYDQVVDSFNPSNQEVTTA